jgi:hypothetical protein
MNDCVKVNQDLIEYKEHIKKAEECINNNKDY